MSLYSSAINLLRSCIISPFLINQVVDSRISQGEVRERGPHRAANFILAIQYKLLSPVHQAAAAVTAVVAS